MLELAGLIGIILVIIMTLFVVATFGGIVYLVSPQPLSTPQTLQLRFSQFIKHPKI